MTNLNLELMAMVWLRTQKRCEIVIRERSPRSWPCGQPDVLGITPARYMIEIEVKRSVPDFRADAKKGCRRNREFYPEKMPRWFYYFAPEPIALKIEKEIPEWAGLMYVGEKTIQQPIVIKQAPVNEVSQKLTFKECRRLASLMVCHLLSSETSRDCERSNFRNGREPWLNPRAIYYDI